MANSDDSGNNFDDLLLYDNDTGAECSRAFIATGLPSPLHVIKHEDGEDIELGAVDELAYEDEGKPVPNQHAINRLEEWAAQILDEISSGKPKFTFEMVNCRKKSTPDDTSRRRRIVWPSKRTPTLKTIAGALKVVEMAHLALKDDVPTTKRDVFYSDVQLFGKQSAVDTLVDDLAATLDLRRADLNIRASLKGLFCGSTLTLTTKQGEVIHGLDCEGTLIPVGEDIVGINVEEVLKWVIVVEKEAVFQTLCQLKFAARYSDIGPGIILTGKGYPDLATRQLVSSFSEELPSSIPVVALVDADPHGLDILSTYKFGSHTMMHENELLVAPRLEWIGVKRSDIEELGVSQSRMLKITPADIRKAESMLHETNPVDLPEEWITELEAMLETGTKAEIEAISGPRTSEAGVSAGARALAQYIHDKILNVLNGIRGAESGQVKSQYSDDMVDFEEPTDVEFPMVSHSYSPSTFSQSTEPELETPEDAPRLISYQSCHGSWSLVKDEPLDVIDLDFENDFSQAQAIEENTHM